jgi:hypothetical protein
MPVPAITVVLLADGLRVEVAAKTPGKEGSSKSRQDRLARLESEFSDRLSALADPELRARLKAVMNARGRAKRRPKAGESF